MKDEIKEILEVLKHYDFSKDVPEEIEGKINKLLDYITNLQEDLKYQKEMYDEYCDKHTKLMQEYSNLKKENEILNKGIVYAKRIEKDYKTRFDNAIELIKDTKEYFHDGIDEELLDILEKRL